MLVVPSIAPESFGLVVAEAMSARIPVIVSDAGALAEVVGGESYPYIVSAGQPLDLAAAIKSLGRNCARTPPTWRNAPPNCSGVGRRTTLPRRAKHAWARFWNASLANPYV